MSDVRTICRTVPGLTKEQLELCYRANDVTTAAIDGLELAVKECQLQFQWHRWNCSSLSSKKKNPHTSNLLKKGYKESAFAFAVSSAGVAYNIARACSQGKLVSCGCDPSVNRKSLAKSLKESMQKDKTFYLDSTSYESLNESAQKKLQRIRTTSRWKWGGCSHNLNFGIEFSELFLDSREKAGDIQSKINLHNNHAGRMAVANNMQIRCKCHGMSGSCQLKTCWKSAPEFRVVGKVLKQLFRKAVLVDQSNMGNGSPLIIAKKFKKRKSQFRNGARSPRKTVRKHKKVMDLQKLENSLFYYQRSPNFCDKDPSSDIQGTIGRKCNRTGTGSGSCSSMCCGRGYNLLKERRVERCNCKFHWCCYVECEICEIEEWISVCN
ncbi:Protein Wnt-10b [Pseudolycoriella hygida]|uniref:Protein Wnt n=1 Tax=Pseudolycoriella hygida TaxID=35572 RepID=A0A9Q0NFD6_9DIPT|nr:Protein Wnt-10b [Pseudolycoriella hygida]